MSVRKRPADLLRDDRGVIMVVGVFFSFLWIGMIWTIFGIGSAIAYRENMQNAADSAAFAGAVYNAQGMNLIAVINNLMGIVLMTLIVMKIAQIINLFAKGADCHQLEATCAADTAACFDIFGGEALCAQAPSACAKMVSGCISDCNNVRDWNDNKVPNFDTGVHTALQVMHQAEGLIAKGWPYVASMKSSLGGATPNFYANGVTATISYSYSENPASSDPSGAPTATTDTCPSFGSGGGTTSDGICSIGPRCGLPVTADHYSTLCQVSLNNFFTLGGAVPGNVSSWLGYGTVAIYNVAGEWFCDDHTQPEPGQTLNTAFTAFGTTAISYAAFWECTLYTDISSFISLLGGGWRKGGASLLKMSGPDVPDTCAAWSPMALYSTSAGTPATMGLDYFSVWGSATGVLGYKGTGSGGSTANKDFAESAVTVAGMKAKAGAVVGVPSDTGSAMSRAEFYYEPYGKTGSVDGYESVARETTVKSTQYAARNVMWNMRWRARLRRYHFMPSGWVSILPGSGGYLDEGKYYAVVLGDLDLIKTLLLSGSTSLPSGLSNVNSETNNPPTGMFH